MKKSIKQDQPYKKSSSTSLVFNRLNLLLITHSRIALIISMIIIILGCFLAFQLTIESNMEDMLPDDNVVLKQSQLFNQYFPSNETTIVVVESPIIDSATRNKNTNSTQDASTPPSDAIVFLTEFEHQLKAAEFITNSLFYIDLSALKENAILYKDLSFFKNLDGLLNQKDVQGINALLRDLNSDTSKLHEYFKSKDSSIYLVFLKPKLTDDFVASRDVFYNGVNTTIQRTQQVSQTTHLKVGLTGGAFIQDIEADTVAFNGLFSTFILTFIIILLFILFAFKKIVLPISTSLPLLGGAILSGSFAYVAYGSLNMFSVSFAILLLGLGIDFGVHILSRYLEEKESHPQKEALLIALNATGPSIIFGALTTALAFYAFIIGKFKAFEQMGVISGTGILILCLMMFTMMPGLILFLDNDVPTSTKKKASALSRSNISISTFIKPLIKFVLKKPLFMPIVSAFVLILLFPAILDTTIVGDISKIYPKGLNSLALAKTVENAFDFNTNSISIYVENLDQLNAVTKRLNDDPLIESTTSIINFLPEDQIEKLSVLDSLSKQNPQLNFKPIDYTDLDPNLINNYVGRDGVFLIEIIPSIDLYEANTYERIKDVIFTISGHYPIGMPVIMNEIVLLVTNDVINISLLCIFIIFIMLLGIYKNILDSLMTLLPLLLSLYTTVGIMNLFGIDINIFSIAAFPLIIGIGIDSSIHLMHRLRETSPDIDFNKLNATGQAIFITSFTTIIGFSSLTRINHPGMANLGFAVAIGMTICLIYTLLLLPSLYSLKHRRRS